MISKTNLITIAIVSIFLASTVFTLQCDNIYDYNINGFKTKKSESLLNGCDGCGYLWSNVTDKYLFNGYVSSCLVLPKTIASKYAPEINMTAIQTNCAAAETMGTSYCYDVFYENIDLNSGNATIWLTTFCCCYSDDCTRSFFDPSIPFNGSNIERHKSGRTIIDKVVIRKTNENDFS
ncbi:Hypothetical protein SRAE_X000025500 [Strongyloides ratti]|uniref:Uncharacterized protein n=1 Tax=Strongyloides ratti TaxID=34506 RepID=A0A090LM53_STRRB|nr:Hypothetical protein SRAE_X000025500 [Strongyloides ratti]CEF70925.1 Hypothetical protein SRAE_X000025500 [Strongyloides ratti]